MLFDFNVVFPNPLFLDICSIVTSADMMQRMYAFDSSNNSENLLAPNWTSSITGKMEQKLLRQKVLSE